MRAVRDFILIVCAIISTTCLVYFVYNIEILRAQLAETSTALQTVLKRSSDNPENEILKRLKKMETPADPDTAPASGDGYSRPARESLKKLIDKPAAK